MTKNERTPLLSDLQISTQLDIEYGSTKTKTISVPAEHPCSHANHAYAQFSAAVASPGHPASAPTQQSNVWLPDVDLSLRSGAVLAAEPRRSRSQCSINRGPEPGLPHPSTSDAEVATTKETRSRTAPLKKRRTDELVPENRPLPRIAAESTRPQIPGSRTAAAAAEDQRRRPPSATRVSSGVAECDRSAEAGAVGDCAGVVPVDGVGAGSGGEPWGGGRSDGVAAAPSAFAAASLPSDAYFGMGYARWFRGRVLSTVCLSVYIAACVGYTPLMSQYLSNRLGPDYLGHNNSGQPDAGPCNENGSDPRVKEVTELQRRVSREMLLQSLASTVPMTAATLVLGSFSDVIGRKLLFFLPSLLGIFKMVGIFLVFNFSLSMWYLYGICFLEGLSGSFPAILMATFAYTADLTHPSSSRTIAIAVIETALNLAGSAALVGIGYCIRIWGYKSAALLLAALMSVSLLTAVLLPETVKPPPTNQCQAVAAPQRSVSRNPFKYVKHIFAFYVTQGTVKQRVRFLVGLASLALMFIAIMGRSSTDVLYQINRPFCWDSVQVGMFGGAGMLFKSTGSLLAVHFLHSCCGMSDATMAFCSLLSALASFVLYGLAYLAASSHTASLLLWNTITLGLVSSASTPTMRSVLSKMAGPSRQGALFASIALTETLCTLASNTVYNTLYAAIVDVLQGGVYLFMAGETLLNMVFVLILMVMSSGSAAYNQETDQEISAPNCKDEEITPTKSINRCVTECEKED